MELPKKLLIPEEILWNKKVNNTEKILLSLIKKSKKAGCSLSNKEIAKIIGYDKKQTTANLITSLKKENKIYTVGIGKKRRIYIK